MTRLNVSLVAVSSIIFIITEVQKSLHIKAITQGYMVRALVILPQKVSTITLIQTKLLLIAKSHAFNIKFLEFITYPGLQKQLGIKSCYRALCEPISYRRRTRASWLIAAFRQNFGTGKTCSHKSRNKLLCQFDYSRRVAKIHSIPRASQDAFTKRKPQNCSGTAEPTVEVLKRAAYCTQILSPCRNTSTSR